MATNKTNAVQQKKANFAKRMRNPLFLAAAAGFMYTAYSKTALYYGWAVIQQEDYRMFVDLVAYAAMGSGVYSTFGVNKDEE